MEPKKYSHIALSRQPGIVSVDGFDSKVTLPKGCNGIFLSFETEAAGIEWFGNSLIQFVVVEDVSKEK